jgi:hypothetical protein
LQACIGSGCRRCDALAVRVVVPGRRRSRFRRALCGTRPKRPPRHRATWRSPTQPQAAPAAVRGPQAATQPMPPPRLANGMGAGQFGGEPDGTPPCARHSGAFNGTASQVIDRAKENLFHFAEIQFKRVYLVNSIDNIGAPASLSRTCIFQDAAKLGRTISTLPAGEHRRQRFESCYHLNDGIFVRLHLVLAEICTPCPAPDRRSNACPSAGPCSRSMGRPEIASSKVRRDTRGPWSSGSQRHQAPPRALASSVIVSSRRGESDHRAPPHGAFDAALDRLMMQPERSTYQKNDGSSRRRPLPRCHDLYRVPYPPL